MKYLMKTSFSIVLVFYSVFSVAQKGSLQSNSTLSCMQGVWIPINSSNEELLEYVIYHSFKSISISYTEAGEFEGIMVTTNGFYDSPRSYADISRDSLQVSEIKSSGKYFVWFFEENISANGWARSGGVQQDFICEGDIIEMTNNAMTILEKQRFLPYTAYFYLKEKSKADNRDYITEFEVINKLKIAEVSRKTHFYNQPKESTKRNAFVVSGDSLIVDKVMEHWIRAAYQGRKTTTVGWLKRSDLRVLE